MPVLVTVILTELRSLLCFYVAKERKHIMFHRFLFTLFVLILIGCVDKTDVTETEVPPNRPPVIDRLILPDRIEANTPLKLQVISHDTDNDNLSIVWEASEGTIEADIWTSPNRATEVVISVHVSDGENPAVSQSKNVTVIKPVTVEPPIVLEEQRSPDPPPREPEAREAWNIIPRVGIEHVALDQETTKVSIGDTIEQVSALAEQSEWLDDGTQVHFHPRLGNFHCIYQDGKTVAITTTHAVFKTREGIGVGAHVDDLIAKYGNPDEIEEGENFTFYYYFARGYMFTILANNHVGAITVS